MMSVLKVMRDQCSTDDGWAAVSGFDDGRGAKTEGTEAAVGMYLLCMEGPMYCSPHYTSPVAKSPLSGDRLFINTGGLPEEQERGG